MESSVANSSVMDTIIRFLEELSEVLANMGDASAGMSDLLYVITEFVDAIGNASADISGLLTEIPEFLAVIPGLIAAIGTALYSSTGFILFIGSLIISGLISFLFYFLRAFPVSRIGKKLGCKYAGLAWIPLFQFSISSFILCHASGKEYFTLFGGKLRLKSGTSFLLYLLSAFFGPVIVTTLTGLVVTLLGWIPLIGQVMTLITPLLGFLPAAICGMIEYVYLRDVLDRFKPDQKDNRIAAGVVSGLDAFITYGLARYVYLFSFMNKTPLDTCRYDYGYPARPDEYYDYYQQQ